MRYLLVLVLASMAMSPAPMVLADSGDAIRAGESAFASGNYEEAVRFTTEAIDSGELDEKSLAIAYNTRGVALRRMEKYEKAAEDYSRAIQLRPNHPLAYKNRAIVYQMVGAYDQAVSDYSMALKIAPEHVSAYVGRCLAYENQGIINKAVADCRKALAMDPNRRNAQEALERMNALGSNDGGTFVPASNPDNGAQALIPQTQNDAQSPSPAGFGGAPTSVSLGEGEARRPARVATSPARALIPKVIREAKSSTRIGDGEARRPVPMRSGNIAPSPATSGMAPPPATASLETASTPPPGTTPPPAPAAATPPAAASEQPAPIYVDSDAVSPVPYVDSEAASTNVYFEREPENATPSPSFEPGPVPSYEEGGPRRLYPVGGKNGQ